MIQASVFKISVSLGLLVVLGACAHGGPGSAWPDANPFELARSVSVTGQIKNESAAVHPLRILFSGNVNGEINPCGCAVNPKGGLDRRLNYVRSLSTNPMPTLLVDAGNAWFAHERVEASALEKAKKKAEFLMRSHHLMGLSIHNVGRLDLSAGLPWLQEQSAAAGLTLTSLSWVDGSGAPIFKEQVDLKVGATEVTVFGLSAGPDNAPAKTKAGWTIVEPEQAIKKALAKVPPDRVVVVLSDLGLARDRELAKTFSRPVVIVGSRDLSSFEIPEQVGQALIVQGQYQGQQWGRIDVALRSGAQGWYNIFQAKIFADEWTSRRASRQEILNKASSDSRTAELKSLEGVYSDLMRFAPVDLKSKSAFEYTLVSMTPEWSSPNELTRQMKAFQK